MKLQPLFFLGVLTTSCRVNAFTAAMKPWGHYSTIGFDYEQRPDEELTEATSRFYTSLVQDNNTEQIQFDNHFMFRRATPSGAELWMVVTGERVALGFEPHFFGPSRVAVEVTKTNEDCSGFEAWIEARCVDNDLPLEFSCPNYAMNKDSLKMNSFVEIQLAAFAHGIETFDTVEKFNEESSKRSNLWDTQEGNTAWPCMYIKSFALASFVDQSKACHAGFTGHVLKTERKVNEKTGQPFYWALVNTLCGDVDVVVDPNCLKYYHCSPPKAGGVIQGNFWLSGRIMNESPIDDTHSTRH